VSKQCKSYSFLADSSATVEALPYLDKVIHEILRFDAPVPGTIRMANVDCVVPLSKPVQGRDGSLIENVRLSKGQEIFIRKHSVPLPC
jgi:hypothetical protein